MTFGSAIGLLLTVILIAGKTPAKGSKAEERLLESLFGGYNKNVGPRSGNPTPLEVTFKLTVLHLALRESPTDGSTMEATIWPQIGWRESRLIWEKSQFWGTKSVVVPSNLLWIPDIALVNAFTGYPFSSYPNLREWPAQIDSEGMIGWVPQIRAILPCQFNYYLDGGLQEEQLCSLRFRSGTHSTNEMRLVPTEPSITMKPSVYDKDWSITVFNVKSATRKNFFSTASELTYEFHFNRTTEFERPLFQRGDREKGTREAQRGSISAELKPIATSPDTTSGSHLVRRLSCGLLTALHCLFALIQR